MEFITLNDKEIAFHALRHSLTSYAPIRDETWQSFQSICNFRALKRNKVLYQAGDLPSSYAYIFRGLVRGFVCDEKGNEYNKNFFVEKTFPGAMTALLTSTTSEYTFETLEDSLIIEIDFFAYRKLMLDNNEIKLFQIYYLEQNWLLAKDAREIEIVQENASARYQRFIKEHPDLTKRLTQYHIASHLGITPTQLSRIRKKI